MLQVYLISTRANNEAPVLGQDLLKASRKHCKALDKLGGAKARGSKRSAESGKECKADD